MASPSVQDVEAELSYAYLHAVASQADMTCKTVSRLADNDGIDAGLIAWGPFPGGGYLTTVHMDIQLKATVKPPTEHDEYFSYWLDKLPRYDDLRAETHAVPRLLVVLFLPSKRDEWLQHSADGLLLKRCAYWASLRGAPASGNASGVTVKLPKEQTFSSSNLRQIAARISRRDIPRHQAL